MANYRGLNDLQRAFPERWNVALTPLLGLPAALDAVARPGEALAFLEPVFTVCEAVGGEALGDVTCGTIGKISGRAPTVANRRHVRLPVRGCTQGG